MTENFSPYSGWWPRYSEYEIADGYVRRVRGSQLVNTLSWQDLSRDRGPSPTPYEELMNLADSLNTRVSNGELTIDDRGKRAITDWVNRYGLLGILPQILLKVTFAPRWQRDPEIERAEGMDVALIPSMAGYARALGGWDEYIFNRRNGGTFALTEDLQAEGKPVPKKLWPSAWRPAEALLIALNSSWPASEPLSKTWAKFFPSIPADQIATFPVETPINTGFWEIYEEPLDRFLDALFILRDTLEELRDPVKEPVALGPLLSPVQPSVIFSPDGPPELTWYCSTLLSALTMLALQDNTQGRRIERCLVCRKFFTSRSPKATYCTARCRQTAQKRAYRRRLSEKQDD